MRLGSTALATERVERKLAAILAADIAGYSRLMGANEEGTLARLRAHRRELIDPKIAEHRGRIVKTTGDGMLVEFGSVVDALRCATEVEVGMVERNAEVPSDQRIDFRIGIHMGDVVVEDGDIFGDAVNVESRVRLANGGSDRRAALLGCPGPRRGGAPASTAPEMSAASTSVMTLPDPGGATHLAHALPQGVRAATCRDACSGARRHRCRAAARRRGRCGARRWRLLPRGTKPQIIESVDWQIREGVVDYRVVGSRRG
jgi:hypothetical protein